MKRGSRASRGQLKTSDHQECRCDVMAEAVFAGEKIKEFPLPKLRPRFTHPLAVVPGFAKEVFMGDGPGMEATGMARSNSDRNCVPREFTNPWMLSPERRLVSTRRGFLAAYTKSTRVRLRKTWRTFTACELGTNVRLGV